MSIIRGLGLAAVQLFVGVTFVLGVMTIADIAGVPFAIPGKASCK